MTHPPLIPALKSAWPLLFGVVMLMIGNGLQGTLLSLRATSAGFDITTTGIVMSMYYVGYVAGSIYAPKMLMRVGHIRVFAALASLASATVLLHYVFVDPVTWGLTRVVTGFAYAGLYVVIESWLNGMATNATRGKILSIYMFLVYLGMMLGQLMLNLGSPEEVELFVLISVLVSIAMLPISLSRRKAPDFDEEPQRLKLRTLFKTSQMGVVGTMCAGLLSSALLTIAPIYGTSLGMNLGQLSIFMTVMVLGGMVLQYPAGLLSDKIDRRKIMMLCCGGAAIMGVACHYTADLHTGLLFYLCAFLFWGLGTPIYALAASHTNDHLKREQIVAASGSLILLNGVGAAFGPVLLSALLKFTGNESFFMIFAATYAVITVYIFYRSRLSAPIPDEEKGQFINISDTNTPVSAQLVKGSQPE
ncbi:MAG: MFS transporter [Alphaproteobacteria bacterium]|nr:MFS transporter [Alphaproteobacteria bacterium]